MGKGGGEAREMESKCVDKRPMLEDEKDGGKEHRGKKRSRNRRNVFSIRSIWCCIPLEIS